MMSARFYSSLMVVMSAVVLSACAGTTSQLDLAATMDMHCGSIPSVTVVDDVLTIGAGEKPTPGYAVQLDEQSRKGDNVRIAYQVSGPKEGAIMAQMITSPCTRVTLPEGWQRLTVENKDSGQQWVFVTAAK